MKNIENKNMNNARQLSLDEIKALPRGSVIWYATENAEKVGICWHSVIPLLVCVPGDNGVLMGGDRHSFVDRNINDELLNDPTESFWSHEPDDHQLKGINENEYNAMSGEEQITNRELASAITGRGITFERFCTMTGISFLRFWKAITGKSEFVRKEIVAIRNVLELTDDEVMDMFFPEFVAQI